MTRALKVRSAKGSVTCDCALSSVATVHRHKNNEKHFYQLVFGGAIHITFKEAQGPGRRSCHKAVCF